MRPREIKIDTEVAHVTRDSDTIFKVKMSKVKVTRPLWLVVLAGQYGHTVMLTMTYIVSPLAGLGGGISWRTPAYSLLNWHCQYHTQHSRLFITQRAKLSGAVYCYRSCLWQAACVCGCVVCLWVCYHDNSKLRASIFTNLGL